MVVWHHCGIATGEIRDGHTNDRLSHCHWISGSGLLDGFDPHLETDVMGFHWVIGDAFLVLDEFVPGANEVIVGITFNTHEVIPCGEVANEGARVDARQFLLAHRKGDDRDVLCRDALVAELFVERNVCVTVDGGDHGGLFALGPKGFDVGDNVLPIRMPEGGVVDHDVGGFDPLALEVCLQDLIGGAGVHIIGTGQHPPLDPQLVHEVVHRGDRLLVRCGAGVKNVFR